MEDSKETAKVFLRKSSLGPGVKGIDLNSLRRVLAKAHSRQSAKSEKLVIEVPKAETAKAETNKSNYACCFCTFQTCDEEKYRRHISSHIQNKALQCSQCSFSTDRISNFNAHVRNTHRKKTPLTTAYSCPLCWFKCYNVEDLTEHKETTGHCEDKVEHKCSLCEHVDSNVYQMAEHISSHSRDAVSCDACSNPLVKEAKHHPQCAETTSPLAHPYEESLEEATKGSSFSCTLCDFQCKKLLFLVEHIKAHTRNASPTNSGVKSVDMKNEELPFCCTMCDYRSDRPSRLAIHMKNHGPSSAYRCKDCEFESSDLIQFRAHRQTHTVKLLNSCFVCLARFPDAEALQVHMTTHSKKLTYSCTRCEYKCLTRARLIAHLKTHAKKTQVFFPCPLCPFKYSTSFSLRNHLKSHDPTGKPYECDFCDYKCFTSDMLKIHVQNHSGGDKFRCDVCFSSFSTETALKVHFQEHASNKYLKCPICPKRFKNKARLEKHSQIHTTGPVTCSLCGETLQDLIARRNHMIRIHGEIPAETPTAPKASGLQFGSLEESMSDESGTEEDEVVHEGQHQLLGFPSMAVE